MSGTTLYVADNLNRRVRAVDLATAGFPVTTILGNGSDGQAPNPPFNINYSGDPLNAPIRHALGLDVLADGDLLVAAGDDGHVRIVHIEPDPAANTTERFAGSGVVRPPIPPATGIDPLTASFSRAYDVSVAPDGTIAVATDLGLYLIEGGLVRRYAGNFTHGRGGDGGPATAPLATLSQPRGLTTDSAGNTYIADWTNHAIRKVDANGIITRFAGPADNFTPVPAGDGGPATSADLQGAGVAVDKQGNVYATDAFHDTVRKITPDGIITTIAGNGTAGSAGDGGPATSAQLDQPWGIAVASNGDVFVSEFFQTRIRKISGGTITTFYDDPGTAPTSSGFSSTRQLAIGPDDSLYVADQLHHQIRRFPPTGGAYEVIAGNGLSNGGGVVVGEGGLATAAKLGFPGAVVVDHAHNVYFNDFCSIRKVDAVSHLLTTLSGNGICGLSAIGGPGGNARHGGPTGIGILGTDLVFSDESSHRVFSIADVVPPPAPPEADVLSGKMTWDTQQFSSGNNEIVVGNPDGTDVVRLTNAAGQDTDPDFSSDGSHITWTTDRAGNHDVWTMRSDGSNQVNLSATGMFEADPSWSPAGIASRSRATPAARTTSS